MSAPGKLVRSSRWKTGPSKGQRPHLAARLIGEGSFARLADHNRRTP
jgi:hypothetical protein